MKRIITLISLTTLSGLASFLPARAAISLSNKVVTVGTTAGFGNTPSLAASIGQIIAAALGLIGVIFLAYMVFAGYLWLTASGNEEKVTKAKTIIKASIIGLIIIFAAYAITTFVTSRIIAGSNFGG